MGESILTTVGSAPKRLALAAAVALLMAAIAWAATQHFAIVQTVDGFKVFTIELAQTPKEQARGLMFRRSMPADRAMLFVFDEARPRTFWMKNTLIPLDIVFFDSDRNVLNVESAQPCRSDPCPTYASKGPAQWVLETNLGQAGTARRLLFYR